jgi:glycosyltransferase involved in cell wall biosynthesis
MNPQMELESPPAMPNGNPRARILYLINSLGGGGAERSLVELLPHFEAAGIEAVVACLRRRTEGHESEIRGRSVDLRYFPGRGVVAWTRYLRELLKVESFALIHTTIFESDIAGRLAAAGSGIPVLTSLVNTSYERIRLKDPNVSRIGLWGARMLDGWTARRLTTHFHAITHAVKDASVRALGIPRDRITVIERGRDPSRMGEPSPERRARARRSLGLEISDEVLVTVGRQEFQKGQKHLIEAFRGILERRPRCRLLVVGREGNASADLRQLIARLDFGDRARLMGYREDVPEILAAADLFVFPSLYEGQGGALVEALALGLPIVATDIPSTREVVEPGHNAVLVPVEAPNEMAMAIERLLLDPQSMQKLGLRSRQIFESRFTIGRSASRMMNLYASLLSEAGTPTRRAP